MCGIGLHAATSALEPARLASVLHRLESALAHRGPDGSAFLWGDAHRLVHSRRPPTATELAGSLDSASPGGGSGPSFGLAFRQLHVRDPHERAIQPLTTPDGSVWIALNGEIYDDDPLRRELTRRGHAFSTKSDAEVALAAYREWGEDCFARFNGMWAIVLVDLRTGTLIASRDRLGIKPLFTASGADGLWIASEPQAILAARGGGTRAHLPTLTNFLQGYPQLDACQSFFDDVRALPPASVTSWSLAEPGRSPRSRRFWRPPERTAPSYPSSSPGPTADYEAARGRFTEIFDDAVRLRLAADVPVGCLVSGGIDSSLVASTAASLAREGGRPSLPCFSIIYREPEMSEAPHVWAVARSAGLASHTHVLEPEEAFGLVDEVVATLAQPLLGQDLIAQYCAYRLAGRHGSTVTLEGQGADELLGGMPRYAAARFQELALAGRWRAMGREAGAFATSQGRSVASVLVANLVSPSLGELRRAWRAWRYDWLPTAAPPWRNAPMALDPYLRWLTFEANLPQMLVVQDHNAMRHGIESRVPFLDHRLVELVLGLPPEFKVGAGRRKRILVDVATGRLPDTVVQRRDKKTFVSARSWIALRPHAREIRATLGNGPLFDLTPVDPARAAAYVDDYFEGRHDDDDAVWRLYTASRWLARFAA